MIWQWICETELLDMLLLAALVAFGLGLGMLACYITTKYDERKKRKRKRS